MPSRFPSLVIGALAAIGVVVWMGCGPGDESRYYCDSAGCYTCDAYGCSTVAAPAKNPCTGNASCKSGEVCTSAGCAQVCSDDAGCPKGEVCKNNICSAPTGEAPTKKECTTKADCGDGKACVAGACQACGGNEGACPCTTKNDCAAGQACVAGSCTAESNLCKYTSECSEGKLCADGQCLKACDAAGGCDAGFACEKGVCKPSTPAPQCTTNAQCAADQKCVAGSCAKSCTADGECGAGNYCNQGACAVDTRPDSTNKCGNDSVCATGGATPQKCIGGFCKYTCTSDQYCRTIDGRIGYCAKDGVCRSQQEAQAACFTSAECNGKSCIDNQCK